MRLVGGAVVNAHADADDLDRVIGVQILVGGGAGVGI